MKEVIKEIEELFGSSVKNNVICYNNITYTPIPQPLVNKIREIQFKHPELKIQIGLYSVKVIEREPKVIKSNLIKSSRTGKIHDDFIMGRITEVELKNKLKDEGMNIQTIKTLIEKWKPGVIKSAISYDIYKNGKWVNSTDDFFEAETYKDKGYEVKTIKSSRSLIKSAAIDCFPVSEEEAQDIEDLHEAFPTKSEFRTVLEDYFHIYDDYADMPVEEFDKCFEHYYETIQSSIIRSNIGTDTETTVEIFKNGHWEFVSFANTPEGWSTGGRAAIFRNQEKAKNSTLVKRLKDAGYIEGKTLRFSQYNN